MGWGFWIWQYKIDLAPFIEIPKGKMGLVSAKDGVSLEGGSILARHISCDNFQNARAFLTSGGQRGKQVNYLNSGLYRIKVGSVIYR